MDKALNRPSGVHPSTKSIAWLLPGYVLLVAVGVLFPLSDALVAAIASTAPAGQLFYLLSKATGLLSIVLVWSQLVLSLSGRIIGGVNYAGSRLHKASGLVVLSMLLLHAGFFVAAVSVRHGALTLGVLAPDFTSGFYASSVSLGVIGLLMFVLASVVYVFRQLHARLFLWGHRCAVLAGVVVIAHSYLIGSETRSALMGGFYLAFISILLAIPAVIYVKNLVTRRATHAS